MPRDSGDLIFPSRAIPSLKDARGEDWRAFVDRILHGDERSVDRLAFSLMMARMNDCMTCSNDSFHAMQGCVICSQRSLKRVRGTDDELIQAHEDAVTEIKIHLQKQR